MRLRRTLERRMLGGDPTDGGNDTGGIEDPEVTTRIAEEVVSMIKERAAVDTERLDNDALLRAAAENVLKTIDPYSSFVPNKEQADHARAHEQTLGTGRPFTGIVAGKPGSFIRVIAALEGSPAWRAGIRPLDTISKINGQEVYERTLVEIDAMFHGTAGETCEVEIIRDGWFVPRTYKLTYEEVQLPAARGEMLPGQLGYLRLPVCAGPAAAQAKAALDELTAGGARALVLDLRGNPGGSMDVALAVVDLFLPADQLVCYSQGRNPAVGKRADYTTKGPAVTDLPLTVIVDRGTADAAEVIAGALQAHKRATIVGHVRGSSEPALQPVEGGANGVTFGKALEQAVIPLNFRAASAPAAPGLEGSWIKLTVGHYFLPGDILIHERGITADVRAAELNIPGWEMDELDKPQVVQAIDAYVTKLRAESPDRLQTLATTDGGDVADWPGLDKLRTDTGCMATPERLRRAVRAAARALLGITAPDPRDDPAARRAIGQALTATGRSFADVAEYAGLSNE